MEWALLAIALAAAASARRRGTPRGTARRRPVPHRPRASLAEVAAAYLGLTLSLWTVGNNDPIHTRFLFPVYALLWVLAFHAYDAVKEWSAAWWERLPWQLLYAGFVAVQLARSWRAEAAARPLPLVGAF